MLQRYSCYSATVENLVAPNQKLNFIFIYKYNLFLNVAKGLFRTVAL